MLVLETALPAKFSDVIEEALGRAVPPPPGFEDLESLPQRVDVLPCDIGAERDYIARHVLD